jgi:hypothetical protein
MQIVKWHYGILGRSGNLEFTILYLVLPVHNRVRQKTRIFIIITATDFIFSRVSYLFSPL